MKYYVIQCIDGTYWCGNFNSYSDAADYAQCHSCGWDYTIEEYESEEDYLINL